MQLLEAPALKKVAKTTYEAKPLSADAIHKQKFKEMMLSGEKPEVPAPNEEAVTAGLRKGNLRARTIPPSTCMSHSSLSNALEGAIPEVGLRPLLRSYQLRSKNLEH